MAVLYHYCYLLASPEDYIESSGTLMFNTGDDRQCHIVPLVDDNVCERPEIERFHSTLDLVSGMPVIVVDPERATVYIDDSEDCRKSRV